MRRSIESGQYLSIRYPERLGEVEIVASVGSKSDSYDALAESFNGLYKTELIHRKGPWRNVEHVERETLKYVDWFNNRRIHESLDYAPSVEFEAHYYSLSESESLPALEMISRQTRRDSKCSPSEAFFQSRCCSRGAEPDCH